MCLNHGHKHFSPDSPRGSKVLKIIGMTIVGVFVAAVFALLFGLVVKLLWNWLMPAIFGLGTITYWQAFGIVLLAKILFGGLGHHHRYNGDERHLKHGHYRDFWEKEGRAAFDNFAKRRQVQEPSE